MDVLHSLGARKALLGMLVGVGLVAPARTAHAVETVGVHCEQNYSGGPVTGTTYGPTVLDVYGSLECPDGYHVTGYIKA